MAIMMAGMTIKSGKQRNIDAGCFGKQWIIDQFNIEQNAADKVND